MMWEHFAGILSPGQAHVADFPSQELFQPNDTLNGLVPAELRFWPPRQCVSLSLETNLSPNPIWDPRLVSRTQINIASASPDEAPKQQLLFQLIAACVYLLTAIIAGSHMGFRCALQERGVPMAMLREWEVHCVFTSHGLSEELNHKNVIWRALLVFWLPEKLGIVCS